MSYFQFTATDNIDFVDKLITHAIAEGWQVVRNTAAEKVLKIPAVGYVAIILNAMHLRFQAFRLYDPARVLQDQIGAIDNAERLPKLPLNDQPFLAWVSISDRRICGVVRISNTYHSFYLGLITPFAPTSSYPFPCFIGGTAAELWGDTSNDTNSYMYSRSGNFGARVQLPNGSWQYVNNESSSDFVWPFERGVSKLGAALDGSYVLYPAIAVSGALAQGDSENKGMWLGYLDGIYAVSQVGLISETIVTVDSTDYLIVPNVFRGDQTYAMRLN